MSAARGAAVLAALSLGACGAAVSEPRPAPSHLPAPVSSAPSEPERLEWVSVPVWLITYRREAPFLDEQNEAILDELIDGMAERDVRAVRIVREVTIGFSCANSFADHPREEGDALRAALQQGPPYAISAGEYEAFVAASQEVGERLRARGDWAISYADHPDFEVGPSAVISTQRRVVFEVQLPAR